MSLADKVLNKLVLHKTDAVETEKKKALREKREPILYDIYLWSMDVMESEISREEHGFWTVGSLPIREAVQELVDAGKVKWHEQYTACFFLV